MFVGEVEAADLREGLGVIVTLGTAVGGLVDIRLLLLAGGSSSRIGPEIQLIWNILFKNPSNV